MAGVLTSLCQALVVIDWDTFNVHSPKDWIKVILIAVPALGGTLSEIKKKQIEQ